MKKLFAMSFLVGFFIPTLWAQVAQKQGELKAAFKQFERQLKKNKSDFSWSGHNQQWFENDCPFLQLKWIKTQKKGRNNYTIAAGDNSVLSWCEQMNNKNVDSQQQELRERWSALGANKKYAIYVDTLNTNREGILRIEYYYECNAQQDSLKVLFIKARAEKLLLEQKKRDSIQLLQAKREKEMSAKREEQLIFQKKQDSLRLEFNAFIQQMQMQDSAQAAGLSLTQVDFRKDCNLYQLKWSYFCMPGGRRLYVKGDNTSLCTQPQRSDLGEQQVRIGLGEFSVLAGGKYAMCGYSIPMGTCSDEFHYYERVDKK